MEDLGTTTVVYLVNTENILYVHRSIGQEDLQVRKLNGEWIDVAAWGNVIAI